MNFSYFLGANSAKGFYSLYDGFCKGEYLSVIKGGPGTGKSGFMRRIGAEAKRRGLDAEYVICSGDINSLDGVYIPALHRGWMDGTAPHNADPKSFGVDGDYVNLGIFCKTPLTGDKCGAAKSLFDEYRTHYARAYKLLAEASEHEAQYGERVINELVNALYDIAVSKPKAATGHYSERFLRCICGEGVIALNGEVSKLCGEVYSIRSGCDSTVLEGLRKRLVSDGISCIVCPSPVEPDAVDALLLPQTGVAFTSGAFTVENAHIIELSETDGGRHEVPDSVVSELRHAKALHDELEEIFKAETDFPALTEFTEKYIDGIFRDLN